MGKGNNRGKLPALVLLWGLEALVLGITCIQVIGNGPLGAVLRKKETLAMLAEVLVLFLWNTGWLWKMRRPGIQMAAVAAGIVVFAWCHQILLPFVVSGLYLAALTASGILMNEVIFRVKPGGAAERAELGFVTGSALWMTLVCAVSLTGHGGVGLWRLLAAALAAVSFGGLLLWGRCRRGKPEGPGGAEAVPGGAEAVPGGTESVPGGPEAVSGGAEAVSGGAEAVSGGQAGSSWRRGPGKWLPDDRAQAVLAAFILTMLLVQLGRLNISLDYDSLHYGLRSPFVLDNGRGIYENLGLISLVYTYSKGLEVLVLPLSGTPTYGFVLAFTLWISAGLLAVSAHVGSRFGGKRGGFWTAAVIAAIPGIMNMAASAKSDNITLLGQLIMYDFLCHAMGEKKDRSVEGAGGTPDKRTPWLVLAVSAYVVTLVYKPTALVFSTALGGTALLCLIIKRRVILGDKKGLMTLLFPAACVTGLWYRTWLFTGVPVTSIFANLCERVGFQVQYPFTFRHVIGNPSILTAAEKGERLWQRMKGIFLAPVGSDMDHVIIAWGTGLILMLLVLWAMSLHRRRLAGEAGRPELPGSQRDADSCQDFFDMALLAVLLLGSAASIYTLSQVDGNYFILLYALLAICAVRSCCVWLGDGPETALKRSICLLAAPFFLCNAVITCATGWSGAVGFTPVKLTGKGFYNHRQETVRRWERKGYSELAKRFSPRDRVLVFGYHPQSLDLLCCAQSYYDITGSCGNVFLVKRLAYFEEFLEYAGIDSIFVEAGYLKNEPRALDIIEDMLEEGSLTDLSFEWGNMTAKVDLGRKCSGLQPELVELFHENYSMERLEERRGGCEPKESQDNRGNHIEGGSIDGDKRKD